MAQMIDLDFDPDEKTLRQFGFIALFGFSAIAALAWFELLVFATGWLGEARETVAYSLLGAGGVTSMLSLVYPKANKPIFVGLSILAFPIGFVLSYVIMGTLFFVVITPIGVLVRLFAEDPMHRGFEADSDSYWSDCRADRPNESYFKQF
ncbi:MAG: SxtJ family membrane protein [Myxococcota bacterium]|nr:SxtJ family membrane protein [Myxococcota bacterium]